MEPTVRPKFPARAVFAALLWGTALSVLALVLAGHAAPLATDRIGGAILGGLSDALAIGIGLGLVALMLWPPFVPWLRVRFRRVRERMSVDRRPLLESLGRLAHFESAHDHLTAGRVLLRMGQAPRAWPHLERAFALDRESAAAAYLAGLALFELGAFPAARNALAHAVALEPEHAFGDALWAFGRTLAKLGAEAEAEQVLARHEARFGPSPRVDLLRARLARRRGEAGRARELLDRAATPPKDRGLQAPEDALARAQARVAGGRRGGAR
jgi:tetratricopeptide (TPR) repeat protein